MRLERGAATELGPQLGGRHLEGVSRRGERVADHAQAPASRGRAAWRVARSRRRRGGDPGLEPVAGGRRQLPVGDGLVDRRRRRPCGAAARAGLGHAEARGEGRAVRCAVLAGRGGRAGRPVPRRSRSSRRPGTAATARDRADERAADEQGGEDEGPGEPEEPIAGHRRVNPLDARRPMVATGPKRSALDDQERVWNGTFVFTTPAWAPARMRPMSPHARILVVEDEPRLGDLLRLYLERDGHAVTVVRDGRAAIEVVDAAADRPRRARPDAPGAERRGRAARRSGSRGDTPGPHRVRQAQRRRADRRPADGRRRLPGQAVQPARADRAGRGHPAAQRAARHGRRPTAEMLVARRRPPAWSTR